MQHDPFSWEVRGKDFCYAEDLDKGSVLVNQTVHQWLAQCTREQRRKFVDAIFDLLASTQRIKLEGNAQGCPRGSDGDSRRAGTNRH